MDWQFFKDLFNGLFFSINSIVTWFGIGSFILLFLPKPKWLGKTKNKLEKIKPYGPYILLGLILIGIILTSYSMYENKQRQITELQNKLAVQNIKTDTKKDIRTFLESVSPQI